MKKIQLYRIALLAMLPAFVLTSCRFEDEDYFDESPALRIEHQGDAVKELLISAPNGWVMQFFCATDVAQFEGFNLFARFDKNGKVTFAGDHRFLRDGNRNKYTEATSLYEMLNEDGMVLAFNVWNDILSPFSDPVGYGYAPTYIIKDGVGMHGDHNFVVMSYNDNEIILRGERHGAEVRLVKCDRDWQKYIEDTKAAKEKYCSSELTSYYVKSDTTTLYFSGLADGKFLYTDNLDKTKSVKVDSLACVFTPNGFRLERNNVIGDKKFHEFSFSKDSTCLENEDGSVKITALWDQHVANRSTIWYLDLDSLSDDLKTLVAELDAALTAANKNNSLAAVGIGKTTNANNVTGLVVQWYTTSRKTTKKMGGITFKRSTPAYGQLAITCDDEPTADNEMNTKAAEVVAAARNLAKGFVGTYNLTPESYLVPSPVTAVSVDGTKKFKLASK